MLKPNTRDQYARLLKNHILPELGDFRVADVTRAEIARLHHLMAKHPSNANKTMLLLSKMFNLAELWGLRPDNTNPCRHLSKYKEHKRERYLPYVGWLLAPPAAAAAFVAVEAFGSGMPSAAGGWEVPEDTLAMVHKNEKILPASVSAKIDNWTGDKGGGDTHVHNWTVNAVDAKGFKRVLDNHGKLVAQAVGRVVRNNNRGVAVY